MGLVGTMKEYGSRKMAKLQMAGETTANGFISIDVCDVYLTYQASFSEKYLNK